MTVLLVSSSVALRWGEKGIERGNNARLMLGLCVTLALGIAFLTLQGVEYARADHMPQADAYWSDVLYDYGRPWSARRDRTPDARDESHARVARTFYE